MFTYNIQRLNVYFYGTPRKKDNSVSIHYRNIQALAVEMYKVANGMSPEIMNEIFQLRKKSHNNLRYTSKFLFHRFIVFAMVASLYLTWDQQFGN